MYGRDCLARIIERSSDVKILSIIVPSYNTSKYIDKFMDSIIDERYLEKIEIVFVNDGSKDETESIINDYQKKYPGVVVAISKENGGHGSTINTGVKIVKGKYFKVIDGDDYVNNDELYGLVEQLEKNDADMFVNVYNTVSCINGKEITHYPDGFFLKRKKVDFDLYDQLFEAEKILDYIYATLHAATFRTSIFTNNCISLSEHTFFEDNEYVLFPIPYVKSVFVSHYNVYRYLIDQATQSVSVESRINKLPQLINVTYSCIQYYIEKKNMLREANKRYLIDGLSALVYCVFDVYVSMPKYSIKNKRSLQEFDNKVKALVPEVYSRASDYKMVKSVRFSYLFSILALKAKGKKKNV